MLRAQAWDEGRAQNKIVAEGARAATFIDASLKDDAVARLQPDAVVLGLAGADSHRVERHPLADTSQVSRAWYYRPGVRLYRITCSYQTWEFSSDHAVLAHLA